MVARGEVYWCDLGEPAGSAPAKRRPVLIIQSDDFNATRLATTLVATLTSNTALAAMPGNVFLAAAATGIPRDSVVDVTQLSTIDRRKLEQPRLSTLPHYLMDEIDRGLRLVLALR